MHADFDIRQDDYESAWQNVLKAYDMATTAGSSTPDLLDQARIIAQIGEPEKTDQGEYARVIKKLSQAYVASGQTDIGRALGAEAESIHRDLIRLCLRAVVDVPETLQCYLDNDGDAVERAANTASPSLLVHLVSSLRQEVR
ncbi:hypothetical protein J3459_017899 [Metarhizium acridum]|nr:hypothetical protein J3459_017899 [Metarhizium acridum]